MAVSADDGRQTTAHRSLEARPNVLRASSPNDACAIAPAVRPSYILRLQRRAETTSATRKGAITSKIKHAKQVLQDCSWMVRRHWLQAKTNAN